MKTVAAAEANRQFSKLLREAEAGETVIVTAHGLPLVTIAKFEPVKQDEKLGRDLAWAAIWDRIDTQQAQSPSWTFNRDELYDD